MQFKQIFLTYLLININKLTISIKLLLKIIKLIRQDFRIELIRIVKI